jgi:hypothetical protein
MLQSPFRINNPAARSDRIIEKDLRDRVDSVPVNLYTARHENVVSDLGPV